MAKPRPSAAELERARRAWSERVAAVALVVIVACLLTEVVPGALDAAAGGPVGAAVVSVLLTAAVAAAALSIRAARRLRREASALRTQLLSAREGERWARAVLDEVVEAVLVASPEGRLVEANQAAARLLGRGRDAILGQRLWDLIPLDDRLVALRRGDALATAGGGTRRLLRPDGTAIAAQVSWSTLADGRIVYLAHQFR